jgi:ABC-2 type transport system ATP-binding protein
MISAEKLSKKFGELQAVDQVSFTVAPGELFGLLGPNGAGKTTTIRMISGLLRPDEGTVRIENYNLWESPRAAKRLLGLVPQDLALYQEFSARENLRFWGGLYGLPRSQLKKNAEELLERVGLADRAGEPVSRYSGGMKRRLNLALGLVHQPKVLLLDEPTVGIDPQARHNILEIIRDIARQGTAVILTTHHLEEAEKLCDRMAIIDEGKILQAGSVTELAHLVGARDVVALHGEFTAAELRQCLVAEPVSFLAVDDHAASLRLVRTDYGIASLVNRLTAAGIELADIAIQKPTLESVFLKLTGRELRD